MRGSIKAAVAAFLVVVAGTAHGQPASSDANSNCLTIPIANVPQVCRTQKGYTGYFPAGADGFSRTPDLDRILDELSTAASAVNSSKVELNQSLADKLLPPDFVKTAESEYRSAEDAYIAAIQAHYSRTQSGDAYSVALSFYSETSDIVSSFANQIQSINSSLNEKKTEIAEQNNLEEQKRQDAENIRKNEERLLVEAENRRSEGNLRQISSSIIMLISAAIFLWIAKIYVRKTSLPEDHEDEFSTYGGNFNSDQMEIYKSVRDEAEGRDFWKSTLIGIFLAGCGIALANSLIISNSSNFVSLLLLPGVGVWLYATLLVVMAHMSRGEGRVRKFIKERSEDLQCPNCDAHFAAMTERLGEKLIAAIPRQSRSVGNRNSNGNRLVFESYWTEARYEVRMRDHCACCDYDKRYLVQETREENKKTTRYSE